MRILSAAATDVGKSRHRNEDSFFVEEKLGLYVVCDGLGGHTAGEVASEMAVSTVTELVREHRAELVADRVTPGAPFKFLSVAERAVQQTCRRIYERAVSEPHLAGMGTTLTLLLIIQNKALMAHVGDCRLYVLREGHLHQLSQDHTMAQELAQQGALDPEYEGNLHHVLTRCVGAQESVQVDTLLFDLLPGDTCLLATDGLSQYIDSPDEISAFLAEENLRSIPRRLVDWANSRGGEDNTTVLVIRAEADTEEETATPEIRERIESLRQAELFRGLPLRSLLQVSSHAEVRRFDPASEVVAADSPCDGFHLVLTGSLAVVGKEGSEGARLSRGESFGDLSLVREVVAPVSIRAEEEAEVMVLPRSRFDLLVRRFPRLGQSLLRRLVVRSAQAVADAPRTPFWARF